MSTVEEFIKEFSHYGEPVIDCFTTGNCYWFAFILSGRFFGRIVYNPVENHFACEIDGKIYDITGECKDRYTDNWYYWKKYQTIEPLDSMRVIRDCVLK